MNFFEVMETLVGVAGTTNDVLKWINDNLLSRAGSIGGGIVSVVNFILGLFKEGGYGLKAIDFFKDLFGGKGLGAFTDLFKGLF